MSSRFQHGIHIDPERLGDLLTLRGPRFLNVVAPLGDERGPHAHTTGEVCAAPSSPVELSIKPLTEGSRLGRTGHSVSPGRLMASRKHLQMSDFITPKCIV